MNKTQNKGSRPQSPRRKELKVSLLGGAEEIGINGTLIEYGRDIYVIDLGFGFPENDMYGVDHLIPNVDYLIKNKERIKGIIITHGHMDHIGGIPYVYRELGFPKIYSSEFTLELIKLRLEEFGLLQKAKLNPITTKDVVRLGDLKISFFRVSHSVPDPMGIAVHTPYGVIVNTGDFKLDDSPYNEPPPEYGKMCDLGEQGVLLAMSDSTNALKKGRAPSESDISQALEDSIRYAKGRVIASTFASSVTRVNQLVTIGVRYNRKIALSGRSMLATVAIARKLGFIKADKKHFIDARDVKNYDDKQVLFIATGSQGEEFGALARMAREEHRDISVKKGDTVILSSKAIPGNILAIQKVIDDLVTKGADVISEARIDIHASGHGQQDDQKLMINMLQPKNFMPIHGHVSFLLEHKKTAMKLGIKENNIIMPKNGQEYVYKRGNFELGRRLATEPILVSGKAVGQIGDYVLREREQLAHNGMMVLGINLDEKGVLAEPIQLISRGIVYAEDRAEVIKSMMGRVEEIIIEKKLENKKVDAAYKSDLHKMISRRVGRFVRNRTDKDPVILPVFV